jgi:hypothetical protein
MQGPSPDLSTLLGLMVGPTTTTPHLQSSVVITGDSLCHEIYEHCLLIHRSNPKQKSGVPAFLIKVTHWLIDLQRKASGAAGGILVSEAPSSSSFPDHKNGVHIQAHLHRLCETNPVQAAETFRDLLIKLMEFQYYFSDSGRTLYESQYTKALGKVSSDIPIVTTPQS